jgi:hypothetical protein
VPEDRLSDASSHQLLRIAQEAIHNAVRHANPTLIAITLRWDARNVVLEVRDNGLGISAGRLAKCEGFGLGNMKKRARKIDARFEIKTAPGQGTSIIVIITFLKRQKTLAYFRPPIPPAFRRSLPAFRRLGLGRTEFRKFEFSYRLGHWLEPLITLSLPSICENNPRLAHNLFQSRPERYPR